MQVLPTSSCQYQPTDIIHILCIHTYIHTCVHTYTLTPSHFPPMVIHRHCLYRSCRQPFFLERMLLLCEMVKAFGACQHDGMNFPIFGIVADKRTMMMMIENSRAWIRAVVELLCSESFLYLLNSFSSSQSLSSSPTEEFSLSLALLPSSLQPIMQSKERVRELPSNDRLVLRKCFFAEALGWSARVRLRYYIDMNIDYW